MELNQTIAQLQIIERQLNSALETIDNLSLDVVISDYDIGQLQQVHGRIQRKIVKLEGKANVSKDE
jgi:hypothetical protein